MQVINVILGTDEGRFRVVVKYTKNGVRKELNRKFPATEPQKVLNHLKTIVKRFKKIDNVLSSSSMDFPEEYGVTRKQVDALYKLLGC